MSMNPQEVNRINYNTYFVDQNLNTYIRRKMQSESLLTPLNNTPNSYDDTPAAKMKLLGTRVYNYPMSDQDNYFNYKNKLEPYEQRFNDIRYRQQNKILTKDEYLQQQNSYKKEEQIPQEKVTDNKNTAEQNIYNNDNMQNTVDDNMQNNQPMNYNQNDANNYMEYNNPPNYNDNYPYELNNNQTNYHYQNK